MLVDLRKCFDFKIHESEYLLCLALYISCESHTSLFLFGLGRSFMQITYIVCILFMNHRCTFTFCSMFS